MGENCRKRRDRELKNNEQVNGWTGREWERKRGNVKERRRKEEMGNGGNRWKRMGVEWN